MEFSLEDSLCGYISSYTEPFTGSNENILDMDSGNVLRFPPSYKYTDKMG